jgi:uncharacterized protein YegL
LRWRLQKLRHWSDFPGTPPGRGSVLTSPSGHGWRSFSPRAAIAYGLDILAFRKEQYRANGIAFYRPRIILVTDGGPTHEWRTAADRLRVGEANKSFAFFSVGVQGAQMDVLQDLSTRQPLRLDGLRFRDLFQWLSNSQQSVSKSTPVEDVPLANPAARGGWATV